MNHTYEILEFNKIREKLAELSYTDSAKKRFEVLEPILSESELDHSQKETTEARIILDEAGMPPLTSLTDMERILITADQGGFLLPEQLEYVGSNLAAVKRLKEYLCRLKTLNIGLPYYEAELNCMEELRREIALKIRGDKVDDEASRELKSLRREIEQLEIKKKEKAENALRVSKDYLSEGFITMKNGRTCLPVRKDCKAKVSGNVIDKSSTGQTIFIEPSAVAKITDELSLVRMDEENEERRILYLLSGMVSDQKSGFEGNAHIIEKLDFIFAKGKLSYELQGIRPQITMERSIEIVGGRHPFLDKDACIPLNFKMGGKVRGIVITGPNMGGKTVSIKTVGLLSVMAQCGLHVPCEKGVFTMNNQVLCDIGDGQNITENLSTFSAHITNTLSILQSAGRDSMVIMDELGSGTDPAEGMGIAVAILEELRKCGCLFLVTTHYPEVKLYAEKTDGVINARMGFDKESLKPLYRLEIGEAGESCAFYIARHLGMSKEMLQVAERASYGNLEEDVCGIQKTALKRYVEVKGFAPRLTRKKEVRSVMADVSQFTIGDSVMIYPEQKIGIVCRRMNEKGELQIQFRETKIRVNHKRVKLHVKAAELYPADYDFSIIFNTVEERKARHQMEKKYSGDLEVHLN